MKARRDHKSQKCNPVESGELKSTNKPGDSTALPRQRIQCVSGIGLARWPDIPLHGGEAQGGLLIPVSGVDDAEGRDREQVGEEKIGERPQHGTFKRDMIKME